MDGRGCIEKKCGWCGAVIKNDRDPLKGRLLQHPSEDVHHATIREPLLSPDGHDVISRRHSDHMGLSLEVLLFYSCSGVLGGGVVLELELKFARALHADAGSKQQ